MDQQQPVQGQVQIKAAHDPTRINDFYETQDLLF